MFVVTDVCVPVVFVWEETGVPGGNPSCERRARYHCASQPTIPNTYYWR